MISRPCIAGGLDFVNRCLDLMRNLQAKLVTLNPDIDLGLLQRHALEQRHPAAYGWLLAKQALQLSHRFLNQASDHTVISFLNYFCWQTSGLTLFAPSNTV